MTAEQRHAEWTKGRDGEWLIIGPRRVIECRMGALEVRSKNGTIQRHHLIWRSRPFMKNGIEVCLGRPIPSRPCDYCGGRHNREEVRGIYAGGEMRTGAYWRDGENDCSCGGKLAGKEVK